MDNFRVTALTPWFPNRPGDRQGNFIHDSVAALARLGTQVDVLVARPMVPTSLKRFHRDHLIDRFDPHAFPELSSVALVQYPSIPRNYLWRLSEWSHDRIVGPILARRAVQSGSRIIHAHTEGEARIAVAIGRKLGLPVIVTIHGINTGPRYFSDPKRYARFAAALRAADRVILVGEPLREILAGICGSDENFCVVHNGVDPPKRSTVPFSSPGGLVRFISVSNLDEGKGVDVALRALALARDAGFGNWTFTIVGDGPQSGSLAALAVSLKLADRVSFLGARPHGEVPDLLVASDVFLLPSYREAFGVAYLEAMSAGLLAVGVRGQGPSAFIQHGGTGLLCEPRDAAGLCNLILEIGVDPARTRRIAARGAEHIRRNFTWDAHALRLAGVYAEVLPN